VGTSYRRLQVDVTGSESGFTASMNRVVAGLTRVGSGLRQGGNDAGLFSKQLMAIGTTARYALAGQLVFGITGALSRLGDFKAELGTIDSLAGQIDKNQNFTSIGNQLNAVGTEAILMSNKFGIAVGDVESYMQRFFSSFDVPGGVQGRMRSMDAFVERVSELQAMMGSEAGDPQALAGGIAGLISQIPGGRQDIPGNTKRIANMIAYMTRVTPNITGRDISRDIGRVGATMTLANMTPEQAFSVWGVAGMAGGSASVIGRGVAQLLGSSLLHPNTPAQQRAYMMAGLPTDPTTLRQMGGMNILERMLRYVGPNARIRNRGALSDENICDADAIRAAGVSGINLTAIYQMLGRQESVRQFVNLLGQGGVKALRAYIDHQQQAIKVDQQRQRYEAAAHQRTLLRFSQARQNLSMSLVNAADWPIEHLIADPVIGISNQMARHKTATQVGIAGALGIAAASRLRALSAFRTGGRFGRAGRALGILGNAQREAIGGAITAEELPAAIAGGKTDGTRANPYWVIISPLSWSVGSPGGFMSPTGAAGGKAADTVEGAAEKTGSRMLGWLKKAAPVGLAARYGRTVGREVLDLGRYARGNAKIAGGGIGLAALMALAFPDSAGIDPHDKLMYGSYILKDPKHHSGLFPRTNFGRLPSLSRFLGADVGKLPDNVRTRSDQIIHQMLDKTISPQRADTLLQTLFRSAVGGNPVKVEGQAHLTIDVNTHNPDGSSSRTRKRAHINVVSAKQFPSTKGKPGSRKGAGK
jgi:hypothetical protein